MLRRKTQRLEIPDGVTVADLLAAISGSDEHAQIILKQTRAFIDGKQADRAVPLSDGVKVIFMRPIGGGSGEVHLSRTSYPFRRSWKAFAVWRSWVTGTDLNP